MRSLIAILGLTLAGAAGAATTVNFAAATDGTYVCYTYCMGFTTDDPSYAVDYVNIQFYSPSASGNLYRVVVSLNGLVYSAIGNPASIALTAADGAVLVAVIQYNQRTTCTNSGRGQHCTTRYYPTGGSLLL